MEQHDLARVTTALTSVTGGDADHVFEMLVPLGPGAHLLSAPEQTHRARRVEKGVEIWSGKLEFEGECWVLHSDDDDDPIWFTRFGALRPGEYITLYAPTGVSLVFRILKVDYPISQPPSCLR
jgi:hypothetical protein